jgi:hypothetical protein
MHTDQFEKYANYLQRSQQHKLTIPKSKAPHLPERFEESYPANEMQEPGATASYRDNKPINSVHIIEYEDHWSLHIDDYNPRHNLVKHLVDDAPLATATAVLFAYGLSRAN